MEALRNAQAQTTGNGKFLLAFHLKSPDEIPRNRSEEKKNLRQRTRLMDESSINSVSQVGRSNVGLTSQGDRRSLDRNVACAFDPWVVDCLTRDALQPENEGADQGRDEDGHDVDPQDYFLPEGDDDAQQEKAEGDLGHSHADDGEGLPDHLRIHGVHRIVDGQFIHVPSETRQGGKGDEGRVEEHQDLAINT